jgi:hypothetical protein
MGPVAPEIHLHGGTAGAVAMLFELYADEQQEVWLQWMIDQGTVLVWNS